mgnify:CR=1 FL=1
MNTIRPAPDLPPDPDDAAAYWAMRRRSGKMTPPEERALDAWRLSAEENQRALDELERALGGVEVHGEALLAEEFARQLEEGAADERSSRIPPASIAASIVAAALLSAGVFFAISNSGPSAPPQRIAYETAIGESETIMLADGSQAQLNTASRIAVAYTKTERGVDLLAGQAFFEIEKDPSKPFVVRTPNAAITVTGTSFDILFDGSQSSVHVVTGVVDVTPRFGPTSTLLAGDMIEIDVSGKASAVLRFDPSLILAWRGGKARFRDEPLGNVVASLNRYFATPIVLENEALADLPVTGEFDIRDRGTAVNALALIFGLEARDEPARTVLAKPDAP